MATLVEDFADADYVTPISGNWTRVSNASPPVGTWALRSASISHNQSTTATVTVPAGATQVEFLYRVSSEVWFDTFTVTIGNSEVLSESGEVSWRWAGPYSLGSASQIQFTYSKDASESSGSDCAWIAQLTFHLPDQPGRQVVFPSAAAIRAATW